ncbi:MAG TPA: TolC family protein [Gemmatimonadaceae bacterium]|nr:TolC family protein [Gemmatimonadaceae bacterium]
MSALRRLALGASLLGAPALAAAQATGVDTLTLAAMQEAARQRDPRAEQLPLLEAQTQLRLRGFAMERRPALALEGQGQYQSDVTRFGGGIALPGGARFPTPPHDTWDASLRAQQRVVDPTLAPRRAAERAQLEEGRARVRVALYGRRQEVNDAFFTALLLQTRQAELATLIDDLSAQQRLIETRVREGAALPGESAALRATVLRRQQDLAAVRAERRAALAVLARLTDRALAESSVLVAPATAAPLPSGLDTVAARPEHAHFRATRERLARQAAVAAAQERPRLDAFARTGYGKPGLNMVSDRFDSYWLVGLRVQWAPTTWGAAAREREILALQERIVRTDEAAFADALQRAAARDVETIDRVTAALALDDEIITLRERIEREARARLREGVLTAAEYVDRRSDVLEARLARAAHATELAQARARLTTTLGLEVP